jgi:hypothetical protein
MAITQAIANSFKKQLLEGDHNFASAGGDEFKIALYTSSATLNSATTVYANTNEVSNTGQYVTGGGALVNAGTSITAAAVSNSAVAVLDFGSDKTATSGTFTIQFPAPTSTAAILRISG